MDYNERMFSELESLNVSRETNFKIERIGLAVRLVSGDVGYNFSNAKLAKIFVENYKKNDTIKIETNSNAVTSHLDVSIPASGTVSQNNDETLKKRRGRPKKADNDRTSTL